MPDKENDVYIPLLQAFIAEINLQNQIHPDIPSRLVEYLLGKHDFYKVISIDKQRTTQIQSYNLHGTLNRNGTYRKASMEIPIASLPTRIVSLDFVLIKRIRLSFIWMEVGNSLFAYTMQRRKLSQV